MYLPLSAIQLALQAGTGDNVYWVNDVVTGSVVMLQAVFIVGLRLLAEAMEKPYESDLEDLSVITYISTYCGLSLLCVLWVCMPTCQANKLLFHSLIYLPRCMFVISCSLAS